MSAREVVSNHRRLDEDAFKGTALTTFLDWYVSESGPEKLAKALRQLPDA